MKTILTLVLTLVSTVCLADSIKLVTSGNFAPFTDEDWKNRGMITDILDQVMRVADLDAEIEFQPTWGNLMADTEAGKYDGTFPWYYNEERAARFLVSESLGATYVIPYVMAGSSITAHDPGDLAGYRLCRPAGYFTHDLEELLAKSNTTLTQPDSLNECFELLRDGHIDIVPVDLFSAKAAITSVFDNDRAVQQLSIVFSRQTMHLLIPKNHPNGEALLARINRALFKLETRGILQSIRDNHATVYLKQF